MEFWTYDNSITHSFYYKSQTMAKKSSVTNNCYGAVGHGLTRNPFTLVSSEKESSGFRAFSLNFEMNLYGDIHKDFCVSLILAE